MLTTRMAFVLQPGPTVTEGILQYLLDVKICKSINQTCSDDEIQVIHVRGDTVPLSDDIIKFINVKLPVSVCNQLRSCCLYDEQEDAWNKKYFPTLKKRKTRFQLKFFTCPSIAIYVLKNSFVS